MKHLVFSSFFLFYVCAATQAQIISPSAIGSGGNSKAAGGILLEDNLGGMAVSTFSTATFMYTQGFLQPDAGIAATLPFINDVTLSSGTVLDNAGGSFVSGGVMIEFTLGELASVTLSGSNSLLTQGILQPYASSGSSLPVTGLDLSAKRLSATTVQLDWRTLQESNNKGFHIERRRESETDFAEIGFVGSRASGGNSSFPLQYQQLDNNSFTGRSLYRLRQEDNDGRSSFSVVRIVNGSESKLAVMQVWPVPGTVPVNVRVSGLLAPDLLMVFDLSGKLIKQVQIVNDKVVSLTSLTPGTYILRLAENKELVQKIIVH